MHSTTHIWLYTPLEFPGLLKRFLIQYHSLLLFFSLTASRLIAVIFLSEKALRDFTGYGYVPCCFQFRIHFTNKAVSLRSRYANRLRHFRSG
nr:MAG TPA: hypothetical protein [Caudoviricetes sp.]